MSVRQIFHTLIVVWPVNMNRLSCWSVDYPATPELSTFWMIFCSPHGGVWGRGVTPPPRKKCHVTPWGVQLPPIFGVAHFCICSKLSCAYSTLYVLVDNIFARKRVRRWILVARATAWSRVKEPTVFCVVFSVVRSQSRSAGHCSDSC